MTERRYQMIRLRAGDYLLPSNDGKTLYRLVRYVEDEYSGVEPANRGTYWSVQRYTGPGFPDIEAMPDDALDRGGSWGEYWEERSCWHGSRRDAIEEALS